METFFDYFFRIDWFKDRDFFLIQKMTKKEIVHPIKQQRLQ